MLVHGFASSFEHGWRPGGWIDLLADAGREVIAVDLPGHGNAPAPHDPAAYTDVDRVVETALPGEPVDGIGFSLGAQLLLRVAARRPERFSHLVVIGVGDNLFRDDTHPELLDALEHGGSPEDVSSRLFLAAADNAGNDHLALAAFMRRPRERFTRDELARVTCPTLVILGDRDLAGPAEPLMDALPDATLCTLPGIDHFRATSDFGCLDAALEFIGASL